MATLVNKLFGKHKHEHDTTTDTTGNTTTGAYDTTGNTTTGAYDNTPGYGGTGTTGAGYGGQPNSKIENTVDNLIPGGEHHTAGGATDKNTGGIGGKIENVAHKLIPGGDKGTNTNTAGAYPTDSGYDIGSGTYNNSTGPGFGGTGVGGTGETYGAAGAGLGHVGTGLGSTNPSYGAAGAGLTSQSNTDNVIYGGDQGTNTNTAGAYPTDSGYDIASGTYNNSTGTGLGGVGTGAGYGVGYGGSGDTSYDTTGAGYGGKPTTGQKVENKVDQAIDNAAARKAGHDSKYDTAGSGTKPTITQRVEGAIETGIDKLTGKKNERVAEKEATGYDGQFKADGRPTLKEKVEQKLETGTDKLAMKKDQYEMRKDAHGAQMGTDTGYGSGMGTDTTYSSGAGMGAGYGSGVGTGTGAGYATGIDTGAGYGSSTGTGMGNAGVMGSGAIGTGGIAGFDNVKIETGNVNAPVPTGEKVFSVLEDHAVEKERVETWVEHRPVEREFVTTVEATGITREQGVYADAAITKERVIGEKTIYPVAATTVTGVQGSAVGLGGRTL